MDMEKQEKLFKLLTNFGFVKSENNKYIYFKNNVGEIFVYPKELSEINYVTTRHFLDCFGYLDKKDYNFIFNM